MTTAPKAPYRLTCDGCGSTWNSEVPLPAGFQHHHDNPLDDFLEAESVRGRRLARRQREKYVEPGEALLLRELTYTDLWPSVRSLKRRSDLPERLADAEKGYPQLKSARKLLSPAEFRKLVGDIRPGWKRGLRGGQPRVPSRLVSRGARDSSGLPPNTNKPPEGGLEPVETGKLRLGEDR